MIKRILGLFCSLFWVMMSSQALFAKTQEIKISVLAPEGTTWMEIMHQFNRELKERTNNELAFKIYSGGVSGDELDVIRKMRVGQIHAGGFTGVGLGQLLSEVRVLELPFIYDSYEDVDYVTSALTPYFEKRFSEQGYEFLGFAEAGFVNIFSKEPITTLADLKKAKMWAWEGDPLVKALSDAYGITPVTLSITDVLTSLQTGLIDSFYSPPLGAIALQWFTKAKYMTRPQMTNSTGAMVMTQKFYRAIPGKHQRALKEVAKKYSRIIIDRTRKDNEKSYDVLKQHGIGFVTVSREELARMQKTSVKVQNALVGKLYPQELLDRVLTLLKERRQKKVSSLERDPSLRVSVLRHNKRHPSESWDPFFWIPAFAGMTDFWE